MLIPSALQPFPDKEKAMSRTFAQHKLLRGALFLAAVLADLVLGTPTENWALTYSCTTIDYPAQATRETMLFGINDNEQIVGWYMDSQNQTHSFLYNAGTFSPIAYPGVTYTYAEGINNSEQIIGYYLTSTNIYGFLDTRGNFSTLRYPNALSTVAHGINNYSQIVGAYLIDNGSPIHGFVYDGGNFVSVDYPGAAVGNTAITGINDFGQMVGFYSNRFDGKNHGFLYKDGDFRTIDAPNSGQGTILRGINNKGQIVGYPDGNSSSSKSFILDNTGTFSSIVCPTGPGVAQPLGINNKGQIIGAYYVNGLAHGVLAIPVPSSSPEIFITATPDTLWPPNGKLVPVTVSGTITDEDSAVGEITAAYEVIDEYGLIQRNGAVTIQSDGSYVFTVPLRASRNGNDADGRHYTITVSALDTEGNEGSADAIVTVPHDQGQSLAER
jgi:probable HAF family extracellular repeat protein